MHKLLILVPLLSGCATVVTSQTVDIYESRGGRQCESAGLSPQQSVDKLQQAGLPVNNSRCAQRTDLMFASQCGQPNGEIIIHTVPASAQAKAQALGFTPLADLAQGTDEPGYASMACSE